MLDSNLQIYVYTDVYTDTNTNENVCKYMSINTSIYKYTSTNTIRNELRCVDVPTQLVAYTDSMVNDLIKNPKNR